MYADNVIGHEESMNKHLAQLIPCKAMLKSILPSSRLRNLCRHLELNHRLMASNGATQFLPKIRRTVEYPFHDRRF
ncbi:MAG: hypothetical protein LC127_00630 [Chitinophagales bacterium]|nr:hypothetical protein [Chitinophagales bacterium]